jgi:hypothetical protein
MKLLLTADLHFRLHWFRWLIEQAPSYDLVCIAGDLLDMFNAETRLEQARQVRTLIRKLADLVPVAVCSGNHDNAGRLVSHDGASVYEWFLDLGTHRNIITDGSTQKLENLIVTAVPYHCSRQEKSIWLDRGSIIRKQTGMPWIVHPILQNAWDHGEWSAGRRWSQTPGRIRLPRRVRRSLHYRAPINTGCVLHDDTFYQEEPYGRGTLFK